MRQSNLYPQSAQPNRPGLPPHRSNPLQPPHSTPHQRQRPTRAVSIVSDSNELEPHTGAAVQLIASEIQQRSLLFSTSLATPLVFVNTPAEHGAYVHITENIPNSGEYRLKNGSRVNSPFLEHENRLWELLGLTHILPLCRAKNDLEDRIWREIDRCSIEKGLHWNQQRMHLDIRQVVVNNEVNFVPISRWEPSVLVSMVVTAMMTELFHVTRNGGSVLLAGLRDVVNAVGGPNNNIQNFPKDPRTVCRQLHLDPVTETYLCCPSCWALKPYNVDADNPVTRENPDPDIPTCQDRVTQGDDVCGAELWKKETIRGKVHCTPHLTYVHQRLKDWLGRILSRPGIEDILDTYPQTVSHVTEAGAMSDIWSSPEIQNLKGPDGKPFLEGPEGEGRYLFSFATDGFNPYQNKQAKQQVTSTGFWAILLNFPIHLRYLFENMCHLGTGPGPYSPSVGRLNPFLALAARDFLEFWEPGVFYTRTHKYRMGRRAKGMMIPLAADMLAARAAAGFTSATSRLFCIGCGIDIQHIEEFDPTKWASRSHEEHLRNAYAWLNAASSKEQEKLAKQHGARFTPFLELPYWQAVRYVLTEPMHALDLRLIDNHVRNLFRIDLEVAVGGDGSEPRVPRPRRPTVERTSEVLKLFQAYRHSPDFLAKILASDWTNFATLFHICNDHGLRISGKGRAWFVLRIKKWMDENDITDEELLTLPTPEPVQESVQTLKLAAIAALHAKRRPASFTELHIQLSESLIGSLYRGTKLASLGRIPLAIFVHVCDARNLPFIGSKEVLYDRLMASVYSYLLLGFLSLIINKIAAEKQQLPPGDSVNNRGAVLGEDVMQQIWADMRRTVLPSWVGTAPKNWGTAKRGKLSADHWRTIFTIHLPITLIWLWRDETGRKQELLFNLTHGVMALLAAHYRLMDGDIAAIYDDYIKRYMDGVAILFKEDSIIPSQHSAFHIGQNLRDFGPQHSRGAQFYERYIHLLQRQNTNMKFGEMEATFMKSTARTANLKALLADNPEIRAKVSEAIKVYEWVSNRDSRGVRLATMLDPEDHHFDLESQSRWESLSPRERQLLHEYLCQKYEDFVLEDWKASASIMDQIAINGVRYARKNVLKRDQDSHIMFTVPETDEIAPGKIQNIFQYWHTTADGREIKSIYLIVSRYKPDPVLNRPDPYRVHPRVFGALCSAEIIDTGIIENHHVRCHFAPTPIEYNGQDLIHYMPLSRVRPRFFIDVCQGSDSDQGEL
ncbi:hypothetical protein FB451DRAFT_1049806 [Mycena latifolia]|nr:hypothetical protein FB451DRAFT_1049806 [Mycena latifolia]